MFTYFFSNNALFGTEYTKRLRTLNLTFAFTPLKLHLCLNKRLCRQIFGASSYANYFRARVRATSSNRVHVRPARRARQFFTLLRGAGIGEACRLLLSIDSSEVVSCRLSSLLPPLLPPQPEEQSAASYFLISALLLAQVTSSLRRDFRGEVDT